jgi:signal recognition particle subunit SRP54
MLTLIEQAERTFDAGQAASMAEKLASGEGFTLEDFVEQLAMVRKLGPIGNLLGMLPGAAQNREALSQIDDKDLDRAAAIVNSMTREERRSPKIINGSRRVRIANGSGVTVGEVNQLIVRFLEGQKMMRQMMGSIPGMGGMRRGGGQKARGKSKKKGGKGGGRPAGAPGSRAGGPPGGLPAGQPGAQPGAQGAPGVGQLPAGFGRGASGPAGLPDLGDGAAPGGGFRLPPGFTPPQPNLPAGLRGPQAGRRGKTGRKGR